MRTVANSILVFLMLPLLAIAQAPPTFEAASIKPDKACPGPYSRSLPGGLMMACYSVQELIALAYGVRTEQIVGESLADRYDIEATMNAATPVNQIFGPMLQALLEDRFALRPHHETRDMPVYNLIAAKKGAKMPATTDDCVVSPADGGAPLRPSQVRPATRVFYCNHPNFGVRGNNRTLEGKGITPKALADSLSRTELKRTVVDKTGLAGGFDVTLNWVTDPSSPLYDGLGGPPTSETITGPSLFTALGEQLGLSLQASRGRDEVLSIDRVEKPKQ